MFQNLESSEWGLGQPLVIKHINISAVKCLNSHTKWDKKEVKSASLFGSSFAVNLVLMPNI